MKRPIIYSDLRESTFIVQTDKFEFYFSSRFYLDKYIDEVGDFRDKVRKKLTSLYLMPVDLDDYADIVYYSKVEKRGFHVVIRDTKEVINWLGNIKLNGVIRMNASLSESSKTSMQK